MASGKLLALSNLVGRDFCHCVISVLSLSLICLATGKAHAWPGKPPIDVYIGDIVPSLSAK